MNPDFAKVLVTSGDDVSVAVQKIILEFGIHVKDDDLVIIKPNLNDFRPHWEGSTTDPKIIEEIIVCLKKQSNPTIVIVESDHAIASADEEFERLGYTELRDKYGVSLVNLTNDLKHTAIVNGFFFEELDIPETLLRATKIISVAKLKTHAQQKITCNMKNFFGLLPMKYKAKHHEYMNEVLADLNVLFKPDLCIIDGNYGMEGFGPSDGQTKKVGLLIAGTNAVSTDAVAAKIMGFNPKRVPTLRFAAKMGLGRISDIEVISDINLKDVNKFDFIPMYAYWIYRFSFALARINNNISKSVSNLSKFISQFSIGLITLIQGFHVTGEMGVLLRKHAIMYGKGLILRYFTVMRIHLMRL